MQYILFIENNAKTSPSAEEWDEFFGLARQSGFFKGGSEIGNCEVIGDIDSAQVLDFIGGYMRFDADDKEELLTLLTKHPVALHGGSLHLCEMPKS